MIAFGTIDDIDQVAARRSDDRASAGQQEITGVLMDAFAGAQTVVRGNASGPNEVDGISGASVTSYAISDMLEFWMGEHGFGPFLDRLKKGEIE